jgi:3-(3-hydroxy-phenyl)propionate hydroxylase
MTYEFKPYPFTARQHASVVPPLADGVDTTRHQVVIVGGGPVGLTVALGLANHGIRSVVIEADDGVCTGSRAICISRRSLEIIERLGALPAFLEHGLPWTGGRSFYRDTEVLHFTMPQDEFQKLPPMINIAQYRIEHSLLEAAEKQPHLIEIRWQTRLESLDRKDGGATLHLVAGEGEHAYALEADWVVACDGGRSKVREALGLQLQGTSYEGRYVIVDIELKSDRPTERLAYFDPPSNPGSTVLVHKQPDNIWRIDYQLRDDEDPEEAVKPENVMPRVESLLSMMGERGEWAPVWITIYKANALTLEKYRHARVMFAGDAAHLVPIFGVRGANSGIDDADNLAWKLAFVVKGLASEQLLDSYSDERVFATHENLSYGMKSTEFMAPPSFAFDLMRTAVLSLAARHPEVRPLINPRQTQAIAYIDSPLNVNSGDEGLFVGGPGPGTVLPEGPVTRIDDEGHIHPGHLTDLIKPHFTVLSFVGEPAGANGWRRLCAQLNEQGLTLDVIEITRSVDEGVSVSTTWDHTGRLFDLFDATPGAVYLVRPDGHVLARWRECGADAVETAIFSALQAHNPPHNREVHHHD